MIVVDTVLKYVLGASTVALGAYVGYVKLIEEPLLRHRVTVADDARDEAKGKLTKFTGEHNAQVAKLNADLEDRRKENSEFERQATETITGLLIKGRKDAEARRAADAAAASARQLRDDAESRYLAAVAAAASADPSAACRSAATAVELLGTMHRETDGLAEEASRAADDNADKLTRLQSYVKDVCLSPLPGAVPSRPSATPSAEL